MQGTRVERHEDDPLSVPVQISRGWDAAEVADLPAVFTGGWVGFTGYDTVRYTYPKKIAFSGAPEDDRGLLDMHLALYKDTVVFDSATKLIYCVAWAEVAEGADVEELYAETRRRVRPRRHAHRLRHLFLFHSGISFLFSPRDLASRCKVCDGSPHRLRGCPFSSGQGRSVRCSC